MTGSNVFMEEIVPLPPAGITPSLYLRFSCMFLFFHHDFRVDAHLKTKSYMTSDQTGQQNEVASEEIGDNNDALVQDKALHRRGTWTRMPKDKVY